MGLRTDNLMRCCQARLICHGPLYRLLMLLQVQSGVMVPVTASHCCSSPIATLCHVHFQVSSHCWWVPIILS
ncbi:unnamed protein product [Staurois parvus]|uniref:Uncharacterized protein n=1 Tax=Staurois parvus TaxID=386267 RepID=A0ABN9DTR4_9NEOB|nr:unnamed protein product [Staurois parvus]